MTHCELCGHLIVDGQGRHAVTGNHWECERRRDALPDWQRNLINDLNQATDHTPYDDQDSKE